MRVDSYVLPLICLWSPSYLAIILTFIRLKCLYELYHNLYIYRDFFLQTFTTHEGQSLFSISHLVSVGNLSNISDRLFFTEM